MFGSFSLRIGFGECDGVIWWIEASSMARYSRIENTIELCNASKKEINWANFKFFLVTLSFVRSQVFTYLQYFSEFEQICVISKELFMIWFFLRAHTLFAVSNKCLRNIYLTTLSGIFWCVAKKFVSKNWFIDLFPARFAHGHKVDRRVKASVSHLGSVVSSNFGIVQCGIKFSFQIPSVHACYAPQNQQHQTHSIYAMW